MRQNGSTGRPRSSSCRISRCIAVVVSANFSWAMVSSAWGSARINESAKHRPRVALSCASGTSQLQPRLADLVQWIHRDPLMTAAPSDVAIIDRVGTCRPSSAWQVGQRRDSNGAKLSHTGQANARTASIVARAL